MSGYGTQESKQRCTAGTNQVRTLDTDGLGDVELQQLQRAAVG
jgi:hypothetical protein